MSEQQSSYRQIMKATSIFGGVQVFNIIIRIIRSKFVAILLGPTGMGITGLLNSTITLMSSLTNFGLGISSVKDIAEAYASEDNIRIARIVTVLKRLAWITGLFGTVITIILSPWLSEFTFGNRDYTIPFIWISITLFINQLSLGQLALLQGIRKIKYLANANLIGAILGLIISLPIYYIWGINGIVPVIIITSFFTMFLSWFYSKKIITEKIQINRKSTFNLGKGMLKMGFILSLSTLIGTGTSYILRIFISNTGGLDQVGLYSAGFVIIDTYVGMIFTAMGTDYYPKLSTINNDNSKVRDLVSQQAILALLILLPIIILFLIFSSVAIQILYSKMFLPIESMVNWAILGMLFKAVSWSMGFILFAKSDSKLFIKTAFGFNAIFLINNILGYAILGLTGLGISFLINFIFHYFALLIITKYRYEFYFDKVFYKIFLISILLCASGFCATSVLKIPLLRYSLGLTLFIVSCLFSYREFDKRLNLKELLYVYYAKFKR